MIKNKYQGNLGNHLLSYFAARLIAEKYNLYLDTEPILGFPETTRKVQGKIFEELQEIPERMLPYKKLCEITEDAISQNKGLSLDHFYGYNYRDYYENNLDKAIKWLKIDKEIQDDLYNIQDNDLLISVRNGDFITNGVALPFEYYQSILDSNLIDYNKVYLISDDYDHPFMLRFKKYNPIYIREHYLCQFKMALKFKYVIASHSTFCWFHILLNKNLIKCFYPVLTDTRHSAWSERLIYKKFCDLRIDLPCMEYIYNVPPSRKLADVHFDYQEWFSNINHYRNSFIRSPYVKEKTDEVLNYHRKSTYRFLKVLPRSI